MNLKLISSISAGYSLRGKLPETSETGVVLVQMKNISLSDGVCWADCAHISVTGKRKPQWLQPDDILVTARGNNFHAVQIDRGLVDNDVKALASPHFYVVRTKGEDILPEFLTWQLNQASCQQYLEKNAEGSLYKSIRRTVLEDTPIIIPPLAKQRAVVNLLQVMKQEQRIIEQIRKKTEQINAMIARNLIATTQTYE